MAQAVLPLLLGLGLPDWQPGRGRLRVGRAGGALAGGRGFGGGCGERPAPPASLRRQGRRAALPEDGRHPRGGRLPAAGRHTAHPPRRPPLRRAGHPGPDIRARTRSPSTCTSTRSARRGSGTRRRRGSTSSPGRPSASSSTGRESCVPAGPPRCVPIWKTGGAMPAGTSPAPSAPGSTDVPSQRAPSQPPAGPRLSWRRRRLPAGPARVDATAECTDGGTFASHCSIDAVDDFPAERAYFADLHVHSDDTVGTQDTA